MGARSTPAGLGPLALALALALAAPLVSPTLLISGVADTLDTLAVEVFNAGCETVDTRRAQLLRLDSTAPGDWAPAPRSSLPLGGVLPGGTYVVCSPPAGAAPCPEECDTCAAALSRAAAAEADAFAVSVDGIVTGAPPAPPPRGASPALPSPPHPAGQAASPAV